MKKNGTLLRVSQGVAEGDGTLLQGSKEKVENFWVPEKKEHFFRDLGEKWNIPSGFQELKRTLLGGSRGKSK